MTVPVASDLSSLGVMHMHAAAVSFIHEQSIWAKTIRPGQPVRSIILHRIFMHLFIGVLGSWHLLLPRLWLQAPERDRVFQVLLLDPMVSR